MLQTLQILLGFLRRPSLYPELMRRLGSRFKIRSTGSNASRGAATQWCEQNAVSTHEALRRLLGHAMLTDVAVEFATEFTEAKIRCEATGASMGGGGNGELLYALAEHFKVKQVIETGVAFGWSSLALLLSLQKRRGSRLISTDMPYLVGNRDRYVGVAVPQSLRHLWTIMRIADRDGIPRAIDSLQQIDLCHYDSDKSYTARIWAYRELWNCLRSGGCFVSDDVETNLAFRDFCESVGMSPIIVRFGRRFVGILLKPSCYCSGQ